jgi:hypothetical protein
MLPPKNSTEIWGPELWWYIKKVRGRTEARGENSNTVDDFL